MQENILRLAVTSYLWIAWTDWPFTQRHHSLISQKLHQRITLPLSHITEVAIIVAAYIHLFVRHTVYHARFRYSVRFLLKRKKNYAVFLLLGDIVEDTR